MCMVRKFSLVLHDEGVGLAIRWAEPRSPWAGPVWEVEWHAKITFNWSRIEGLDRTMVITHCVFEVSGIIYKRDVKHISGLFINIHDFTFTRVEWHFPSGNPVVTGVEIGLQLGSIKVALDGGDELGIVRDKLSVMFDQVRLVVDENDEQQWTNYRALRDSAEDIAPIRGRISKYNSLPSVREKGHYPLDQASW